MTQRFAKGSEHSEQPPEQRSEFRRRARILEALWTKDAESPSIQHIDQRGRVNETYISNQDFLNEFGCKLPTLLADYHFLLRPPRVETPHGGIQLRKSDSYFARQARSKSDLKRLLGWATAWYLCRRATKTGSCSILQGTTLWNVAIALRFDQFRQATFYVLTNSPPVFASLMDIEKVPLIATGGDYHRRINALTGKVAADTFRKFGPTHVVIGASGLKNLTVYQADGDEIAVSEAAVKSVEEDGELVVVADAEKFERRDHWEVCDLRTTRFASLAFVTNREPEAFRVREKLPATTVRLVQVMPKADKPGTVAAKLLVLDRGNWEPEREEDEFALPPDIRKRAREHHRIVRSNRD